MKDYMYVISVKRIKDYDGEVLAEDKQDWAYAQMDDKGPMATGYPCFSIEYNAKRFSNVKNALDWWEKNKKYILSHNPDRYDFSTLAVRKVIYKTVTKIKVK